jgi:hypothetical protein
VVLVLILLQAQPMSPLALAWRHTGVYWSQTLATIAHHPAAILACAAVTAAGRCYVLLNGTRLRRGPMAALEFLVTLWRVMLCAVAVWAACSGRELRALTAQMGVIAAWQVALENVGVYLAHHLRAVLWEILFFALVMLLAERIARWLILSLSPRIHAIREPARARAALSVWRNLILFPVALIYLIEMARPALR